MQTHVVERSLGMTVPCVSRAAYAFTSRAVTGQFLPALALSTFSYPRGCWKVVAVGFCLKVYNFDICKPGARRLQHLDKPQLQESPHRQRCGLPAGQHCILRLLRPGRCLAALRGTPHHWLWCARASHAPSSDRGGHLTQYSCRKPVSKRCPVYVADGREVPPKASA